MPTKKAPSLRKRPTTKKTAAAAKRRALKQSVRKQRPWHRALALHPINLLFLLCVGVLLVAATIKALADSYTVSGVVSAAPLTQPATILDPTDGAQVSNNPDLAVSGSCPNGSYVNLTNNGAFVGTDLCTNSNTFAIAIELTAGANVLNAQDYTVTNDPGPTSPSITVTYTPPPTLPPPSPSQTNAVAPPVGLEVVQIDNGVPYASSTAVPTVSNLPTFSGVAPPFSKITVEVHSNPYFCYTTADAQGFWSCTFSEALPDALHTVYITATTPAGQVLKLPAFSIRVGSATPALASSAAPPFSLTTSTYAYKVYTVGQTVTYTLSLQGGAPPYAVTISWGDGSTSTIVRQTAGTFSVSHTYRSLRAKIGTFTVRIEALNAKGDSSSLQLMTILRNPAYQPNSSQTATPGFSLLTMLRAWSWIIWPGYIIVVLMVFSFWLGERQELATVMSRQTVKHSRPRR